MSGRASTRVQSSLIFCCPIPDTLSSPEDAKIVVCEECHRTSCLGARGLQSLGYGKTQKREQEGLMKERTWEWYLVGVRQRKAKQGAVLEETACVQSETTESNWLWLNQYKRREGSSEWKSKRGKIVQCSLDHATEFKLHLESLKKHSRFSNQEGAWPDFHFIKMAMTEMK